MFRRIFLLATMATLVAPATTLEKLSMDEMIAKSTAIVRAKAVSSVGEIRSGMIFTHYRLQVSETLKGAASTLVDVWVPGGSANRMRQTVPGAPVLDAGQEYLVFLWTGPSGRAQIIGLSQGLFNVKLGPDGKISAERPGSSEMMIDARTGLASPDRDVRMSYSELRNRVSRAAEARQ